MTNKILTALLLLLAASQPSCSRVIPGPCEVGVQDPTTEWSGPGHAPPLQGHVDCLELDLVKRAPPVPVRGSGAKGGSGSKQGAGDPDSGQVYGSAQGYGSQQGYGGPAVEAPAPAPARQGDSAGAPAAAPYTGKKISEDGLVRKVDQEEGQSFPYVWGLVRDPANANGFKRYEVTDQGAPAAAYQVNAKEGILVVESTSRSTNLRNRHITMDNYVNAAGSPSTMTAIVLDSIIEGTTKSALSSALRVRGKEPNANGAEKFEPGSPGWAEVTNNPLIGGQLKMVEENAASFGGKQIKSVEVRTTKRSFGEPGMNTITKLGL